MHRTARGNTSVTPVLYPSTSSVSIWKRSPSPRETRKKRMFQQSRRDSWRIARDEKSSPSRDTTSPMTSDTTSGERNINTPVHNTRVKTMYRVWWCCVCTDDENPKAIKGGANKLESLSFPLHLPAERIHRRVIRYAIHSTSAAAYLKCILKPV